MPLRLILIIIILFITVDIVSRGSTEFNSSKLLNTDVAADVVRLVFIHKILSINECF